MAEYINREAVLAEMTSKPLPNDASHLYLAMRGIVSKAPTADVAEVVRCKDCGMSRETEDERYLFCMQFADTVDCQAFCSYGERSETNVQEVKKDVR